MDETYRMLGREHEKDLERAAVGWQRGSGVPVQRGSGRGRLRTPLRLVLARVMSLGGRAARMEAARSAYRVRR